MTKRRCPWPIETCLQWKSHIGLREVANGVNGRSYTDMIKEYTSNLLMNGAKSVYQKPPSKPMDITDQENMVVGQSQTTITSFFPTTSKTKHCTYKNNSMECKQCLTANIECNFCSKPTCALCSHFCSNCQLIFCSTCSVVKYDSNCDVAICFSCIT